ncbi:protease modulator HflC [Planctomycetaceae bacterium SH139]
MNHPLVKNIVRVLAVLALLLLLMPFFVFIVNEREMAVVLRFGKPVREYVDPGVRLRVPFAETVRKLPKTQQFWGDARSYELPDLPTKDDKKIELIPWAVWRINEPTVFVQLLRDVPNAEQRVAQVTRSAIRDVLTQYELEEIVRSTDRPIPTSGDLSAGMNEVPAALGDEALLADLGNAATQKPKKIRMGRPQILEIIKLEAQKRLAGKDEDVASDLGRGIELVDVGISQIDFVESVRSKTFDRWIAERDAISARNVNEGERLKAKIINETKAEVARIEGEGQQQANETKGEADAFAITKFAEVINEVGEFYTFARTLQAYETAIGKDSRLILTTDSDFFNMLKSLKPAAAIKNPPASEVPSSQELATEESPE